MRIFTTLFTLALTTQVFAQINTVSDGFYRVQNNLTARYLYILGNAGKIDYSGMKAELEVITPKKDLSKALSDPASVIYFEKISGGYNFKAQGTSSYEIDGGAPIQLLQSTRAAQGPVGTYRCYATEPQSNTTLYLADTQLNPNRENGALETIKPSDFKKDANTGKYNANWHVLAINNSDNYFGLAPTVSVGGKHYIAFYAGFAFKPLSSGMKVYKIVKNDDKMAALAEIQGIVPAGTPVIVECSSTSPANNKLELFKSGGNAVGTNMLKGVYFNNPGVQATNFRYKNQVAYDAKTMRVLGKTADGKLAFVKSTKTYLDANTSYFYTTTAVNDELLIVDESYYDAIVPVEAEAQARDNNVYNLHGVRVRQGSTSTVGLPCGIYIIDNKKVVVR